MRGYNPPKGFIESICFICNKECGKEAYCHKECALAMYEEKERRIKEAKKLKVTEK